MTLSVKSHSQELGLSTNHVFDVPFFGRTISNASVKRSPISLGKLEVESRRNGLALSALVIRLVHPDFG